MPEVHDKKLSHPLPGVGGTVHEAPVHDRETSTGRAKKVGYDALPDVDGHAKTVDSGDGSSGSAKKSTEHGGRSGKAGASQLATRIHGRVVVKQPEVSTKVEALLQHYGVKASLQQPQDKLLTWAANAHAALVAAAGETDPGAYLMAVDVRRHLFMLEGLFRIYSKRYGKPLERQLERTKELEDELGAVGYAQDMLEAARHHDAPKKAIKVLEKHLRKENKRLAKLLEKRWLPDGDGRVPAIAELLHAVTSVTWDDPATNLDFVREEIGRRLAKVDSANYDMAELEEGLHELRRQLRWLPIYLTALDGVAELVDDRNPIPLYEPLLRDPIADSKFAKLPPVDAAIEKPIRFSRSLYLANTRLIDELGSIKDEGQVYEAFVEALKEGDVAGKKKSHKKAHELLGESAGDARDRLAHANEIYAGIQRHGLIGAMRGEILHGA